MKRLTIICATMALILLPACAQNLSKASVSSEGLTQLAEVKFGNIENVEKTNKQMKTLVAFFSASGTTENVAKQLAKELGADLYEIAPAVAYTSADLDWTDKQSRSTLEMNDKSSRPAIGTRVVNMDQYDSVLIGFPIWWYTCPAIINTFIESYDFTGKTLIPFATSGGSTPKQATADLRKAYPKYHFEDGKLLNRRADITSFVESLK